MTSTKDQENPIYRRSNLSSVSNSVNGDFLIRSGLTDAICEVDLEVLEMFFDFTTPTTKPEVIKKFKHIASKDELNELLNGWEKEAFIIKQTEFDYDYIKKINEKQIELNEQILHLTFAPTFQCNFKCSYCFRRKPLIMNEETLKKTIEFTINHIHSMNELKVIKIVYYGGEPLLYPKKSLAYAKAIIEVAKTKNIQVHGFMITNGSLIPKIDNFNQLLQKLEVNKIQITIDGDKEEHNKRRSYTNNKGSFNDVLKGIVEATKAERLKEMHIRVNVDNSNYQSSKQLPSILMSFFKSNNVDTSKIFIYYEAVHLMEDDKKMGGKSDDLERTNIEEEFNVYLKVLNEITIKEGFNQKFVDSLKKKNLCSPVLDRSRTTIYCSANIDHSFFIDPLGNLLKCWEFWDNSDDMIVGNVFTGIDIKKNNLWSERTILNIPECWGCCDALICGGGCTIKAYKKYGKMIAPGCRYEVESANESLILDLKENNLETSK